MQAGRRGPLLTPPTRVWASGWDSGNVCVPESQEEQPLGSGIPVLGADFTASLPTAHKEIRTQDVSDPETTTERRGGSRPRGGGCCLIP